MASSNEDDNESSGVTSGEWEEVAPRFTIDSETNRRYSRFNAVGTELTVRLLPPAEGDDSGPITHPDRCDRSV